MKTTILKHRFFYLFILLGLIVSFNGCSDDDDDEQTTQTFLEKYYETLWFNSEDDGEYTEYFKFVSKSKIILEVWSREDWNDEDCFSHFYQGSNDEYKVVENSSDKLVFEITWDDDGEIYTDIVTITVSGDIMKIVLFDDYDNESDTMFWEKSSVNVDDLKMCN